MKRNREEEEEKLEMDIVWQTPADPPKRQDYIFRDGKRYVKPYYFEFISHVKNRWAGKTIVDLFSEEFRGRPYEYYVSAVKSGRIKVDGEMVHVSYIVRSSQKISHFVHRHEPPLMANGVSILQEENDVVTVCKPASIPVHPCGQYRKNTVVGILEAEHELAPLFPVHRLDRPVSGLLILAKSASRADIFRQQIEGGMVKKQYIAKVIGEFPENEQVVNASINYNAREGRSTAESDGSNKPLKGKVACTKFSRIRTNGTHSIVLCEPVTGRTHQIRVHLQHIGHPIANDALYLSNHLAPQDLRRQAEEPLELVDPDACSKKDEELMFKIDPMCTNCPHLGPKGYGEEQEGLWLHCIRYSGPGWEYECPHPCWASLY
ncbi:hypothetical protein SAY87_028325 [Trapa incisa]|uniref:Pseudouridine synthase n=2 Tax=Trapa TaxID=22665 RepID=A0AAN7MAZ3_TRANT|nr:hypothetical protein SAY87_028325 [Trapa incisa]KAK4801567.1 hypothetical protein SAY86_022054 [Trapa natans]